MVNVDNLIPGSERINESDLQSRLNIIMNEIKQLTDDITDNDKIEENVLDGLNGQFADFLMRENQKNLKTLQKEINILINDPELSLKAGPQLWKLNKFLDDITNPDRMKKDYDEFMDRIKNNPKSLNRMKSREIRRLNLYLGQKEKEALNAYKMMKSIVGKQAAIGMKSEDQKFFNSVWDTLKNNYKNDETFVFEDYPQLKDKPSVNDLRIFFLDAWDGSIDKIKEIQEESSSIVSTEKVKEVIKQKNDERIKNNKSAILSIPIMNFVDKKQFLKKDGKIYYKDSDGENKEFTANIMAGKYRAQIMTNVLLLEKGKTDFVNDSERDKNISECMDDLFKKLNGILLDDNEVIELKGPEVNENQTNDNNGVVEKKSVTRVVERRSQNKPRLNPSPDKKSESLPDVLSKAIEMWNLVEMPNSVNRKENGLPEQGKIYMVKERARDEFVNRFYYMSGNQIVSVPDLRDSSRVSPDTFYTKKFDENLKLKNEKSYPPVCRNGCQYLVNTLATELRAVGLDAQGKTVSGRNGRYCLNSFGQQISIDLATFTKGRIFKSDLGKNLKMLNLSNFAMKFYFDSKANDRFCINHYYSLSEGCDLELNWESSSYRGSWHDVQLISKETFRKRYGWLDDKKSKIFVDHLNNRIKKS